MPEQRDVRLDKLADVLGMTTSEACDWISDMCHTPSQQSLLEARIEGRTAEPLDEQVVARALDSVVVNGPDCSLRALEEEHSLLPGDLRKVCSWVLSRRFGLERQHVFQAFRCLEFSRDCPFVGASGRTFDDRLIFKDADEKKCARNFLEALREAALATQGLLPQLADRRQLDRDTGLLTTQPLFSSAPWLGEIPEQVYAPLVGWHVDGALEALLEDIESAVTGAEEVHRRNVAAVARWVWEESGQKATTRNDHPYRSPFMKFADCLGFLFGVGSIPAPLLRSTRSQSALLKTWHPTSDRPE